MMPVVKRLQQLNGWFTALSRREKIMVVLAVFLVPIYLFGQGVILPGQQRQQQLQNRLGAVQQQNGALQEQLSQLEELLQKDQNQETRALVSELREQITTFDQSLQTTLAGLVAPQQMAGLLRAMLAQRPGLTLLSLNNLPPQPLNAIPATVVEGRAPSPAAVAESDGATEAGPVVYQHGMRLEFKGSYQETVSYLNHLQQLPLRLFWQGIRLEMGDDYPRAQVTLDVYTLSIEEGWIGG